MCHNPVGAPVEWCCQFASTLFPGADDECSPSDTGPLPTLCESGLQSSLAGTAGQCFSLAGLDLTCQVEYAGPDIWQAHSSCGCHIVVQGPAGGGWHWLPHSLSGDSHSIVSSSTPVLSWRVLLLRKPLPVPGILHTVSNLPFQHPGSTGRRIGHSRPTLAT